MNGANCNSKNNLMVKAVVLFSLATIAFYLLTEHKAHLLAYSSYIFFLGFVLLHIFMCGRHGKHEGHGGHSGQEGSGGHGGCCGGHNHGEHKHGKVEKKTQSIQNTGDYEDTDHHQHDHVQERFK